MGCPHIGVRLVVPGDDPQRPATGEGYPEPGGHLAGGALQKPGRERWESLGAHAVERAQGELAEGQVEWG